MSIVIEHLTKTFGGETAIEDVNIEAEGGDLTTLVGPSGCGKTTTLRCIAGLERPDRGRITINGEVVNDAESGMFVSPRYRDVGFVFQTFDVWPHMTVFENVAFPLRVRGTPKAEIEDRVMETLELADIGNLRNQNAASLSGGQQARVGISRALVYEPSVLLMDEPLTGLDRNLRQTMRYELRELQQELGITTVYVTHSQPEALTLSDKIVLMNVGEVEQTGTGREIYAEPISQYSFQFFGASHTFEVDGASNGAFNTRIGPMSSSRLKDENDGDVEMLGVRYQDFSISLDKPPEWEENTWTGRVTQFTFLGDLFEYVVNINDELITARYNTDLEEIDIGDEVYLHVDPRRVYGFSGGKNR